MRIEHVALWCRDLDRMVAFYVHYFGAEAGPRYRNEGKRFSSCFLAFESGARLELMTLDQLDARAGSAPSPGLAHFALSTGSEAAVDALTRRLKDDGYPVTDGPRRTGDGYYESVVLDPEQNRLEITV